MCTEEAAKQQASEAALEVYKQLGDTLAARRITAYQIRDWQSTRALEIEEAENAARYAKKLNEVELAANNNTCKPRTFNDDLDSKIKKLELFERAQELILREIEALSEDRDLLVEQNLDCDDFLDKLEVKEKAMQAIWKDAMALLKDPEKFTLPEMVV